MQMWKIEVLEEGKWRQYGQASMDFARLYAMAQKICENGTKARVVRVRG